MKFESTNISMIMNTTVIDKLRERKTTFPAPEEAIDKANACNLLSRDIYTDSTRFIYELLQNADDASCKQGYLTFQIDFAGDYLIVSHNGKPFDEDDIESICSIGDGSKTADSEQTGFKGIGFKSVFAYSDMVIIKSGDYCFKFDKEESNNIWNDNWGNKSQWQKMRTSKNKSSKVSMPWQIIPINTVVPNDVSSDILNSYTVSTIIRSKKLSELREAIDNLFKSAQLILFLRSKHVKVVINGQTLLCIEKNTDNDITIISRNGEVISQWLTHTTPSFNVPSSIHEQMEEDKDHYPEKLREATKASMSFAIKIENSKIVKLDEGANNIYSFLPTTVSLYDFPFIVNSNFITDAGRQNLHQDYIWNQWLFKEMPKHFLLWMGELARSNRYGLEYLRMIIKAIRGSDELSEAYNNGMMTSLDSIPFILVPNSGLKLAKDVVWDSTNISSYVSNKLFIDYINKDGAFYCENGILPIIYQPYERVLKNLGVLVFDKESLSNFLESDIFINSHRVSDNGNLISFLHKRYPLDKTSSEIDILWLQNLTFIFNNHGVLAKPISVCFPSIDYSGGFSDEIDYINDSVYQSLSEQCIEWLKKLGVSQPTDVSIIDTEKIFEEGFVTHENAINILQFIFELHREGKLESNHYSSLHKIPLLTQKGTLLSATNLYLADIYKPSLAIEKFIDIDFFVSEKYLQGYDSANEWGSFLEKIGVCYDLSRTDLKISIDEVETTTLVYKEYAKEGFRISKLYSWVSNDGWTDTNRGFGFYVKNIYFNGLPYLQYAENYNFAKMLWQNTINKVSPKELFDIHTYADGSTGFYRVLGGSYLQEKGFETSYIQWVIEHKQIFPGTDNRCHYAKDLYTNTIPDAKMIAGVYLPVIDVDMLVDESWTSMLGLKKSFCLQDYLYILSELSKEKEILTENRERIEKIYSILATLLPTCTQNQIQQLKDWATNNKILVKGSSDFLCPKELSIVMVEGFMGNKFAYTGKDKPSSELIQLMRLFGVKVIEQVTPNYIGTPYQKDEIKNRLLVISPLLASLKDGDYEKNISKTRSAIESLQFYSVEQIELTYGDTNDAIKKTVYIDENNIYYVGEWKKLRVLNSLAEPLAKFLHIKASYAKLLEILLTSDINECIEYLKEYGITICDEAKEELELSSHDITPYNSDAIVGVGLNGSDVATVQQIAENNEAKQLVLQKLENEGFDVSKADSEYSVIHGIARNGINYPLVVKSCKNQEHRVWINPDEWQQLFNPNSMLWLHFGGGVIAPVKAYELFTYQDKLTLSFDTVNLRLDDRIHKIMKVLHYFNKVKLDLATLNPNKHRAENLNDYLFSDNNANNSDLDDNVEL